MNDLITVKISGLNLSRLITKLINSGVVTYNLVSKAKSVKFSIASNDLKILDKVCKEERKFYTIISSSGIKNLLSRIPYFLGALLAIFIIGTYIYSASSFIYEVNVAYSSEVPFDLTDVNALLQSNGIKSGLRRRSVNTREIQNMILLNCSNVAGCTVKRIGGKIEIIIYPSREKYETREGDIISNFDGVITHAEAFVGELMVHEGDVVKKGDVLIKNNGGAEGKIQGKVYFTSSIIYNENQQKLTKTGRICKVTNIKFFNFFTLKSKNLCPFSAFLTEKREFYLTENYLYPFKVEEITYMEVVVENIVVPFSDVESKVLNDAYNATLILVEDKDKITNVTYSVVTEGIYTRVDCFVETVINMF